MSVFSTLGLPSTASEADVKKSFKALARAIHPDSSTGTHHCSVDFTRLVDAKNTALQLIRAHSLQSALITYRIPLDLALNGGPLNIIEDTIACGHCDQRGYIPLKELQPCTECKGSGRGTPQYHGSITVDTNCLICQGNGETKTIPCQSCHTKGTLRDIEVYLDIPKLCADNEFIFGDGLINHKPACIGVHINIIPCDHVEIRDMDIFVTKQVSHSFLRQGGKLPIVLPDRTKAFLNIKPNSVSPIRFKIAQKGLHRQHQFGDCYYMVTSA
ncbi:DnaJ domain-containing protein [Flexibacterium corallicola]|uniref:DnaJ domain-containing protein n=1 Tax=Flexibacterium corallicola TaxID=3037259 RepID=UPI003862092E